MMINLYIKMFDKKDEFSFSAVCMPYMDSNIPSYIFYGTIRSEIIRIARSTLLLDDLIPRLGALFKRMLKQGANSWKILYQCKKAMDMHSHSFVKFLFRSNIIIGKITPGAFMSFIIIHINIQRIGGTWPVLLGPPDLRSCL